MRTIARVDANQPEIVTALRNVGATVQLLHQLGKGCPDALVGFQGQNYLMEIKTARGTLTADECEFTATWRGHCAVVRSVDEALRVIGALQ